ncbi:hypothetical protein J6590_013271 [Homalodisca vitripennis]|nr:hypothetical protein J6590_013271 [Homalodisca vitripennis]
MILKVTQSTLPPADLFDIVTSSPDRIVEPRARRVTHLQGRHENSSRQRKVPYPIRPVRTEDESAQHNNASFNLSRRNRVCAVPRGRKQVRTARRWGRKGRASPESPVAVVSRRRLLPPKTMEPGLWIRSQPVRHFLQRLWHLSVSEGSEVRHYGTLFLYVGWAGFD